MIAKYWIIEIAHLGVGLIHSVVVVTKYNLADSIGLL